MQLSSLAALRALSPHWTFNLLNDPKRFGFVLARYAFAARMAGRVGSVLELGCSEGIGATVLRRSADRYLGVDFDGAAIASAQQNFADDATAFVEGDFLGQAFGKFDSVVSLDVIEHVQPDSEPEFLRAVHENTAPAGIAVIGTPNDTASPWASKGSQEGHVNMYEADRLTAALGRAFHTVLPFGLNDELAHTGFAPMSHYLLAVGCDRRDELA